MRLTACKLRRLERGLLQIDLARKAKISRGRLSEIENGHIVPRPDELHRLARALAVPTATLLSGVVESPVA